MEQCKYDREEDRDILLFPIDNLQYNRKMPMKSYNDAGNTKEKKFKKFEEIDTYNMYRSVFKTNQSEFQECRKKSNEMVMDKLVAQIVARAQYLRKVILKETYKEDSSTLNDSSLSNELHFNTSSENKEKLDKYILGMQMPSLEEKKVLNVIRSTSPCFIDLMPKIIATDKDNNINTEWNQSFSIKLDSPEEDVLDKNMTCTELKGL